MADSLNDAAELGKGTTVAIAQEQKTTDAIRLDLKKDPDRMVVITPGNEDRSVVPVRQVVSSYLLGESNRKLDREYGRQIDDLLLHLAGWAIGQKDMVSRVCFASRNNDLLFVALQRTPEYNRDFEDALTALDMDVSKDSRFSLVDLQVLSFPFDTNEARSAFISPGTTVLEYIVDA